LLPPVAEYMKHKRRTIQYKRDSVVYFVHTTFTSHTILLIAYVNRYVLRCYILPMCNTVNIILCLESGYNTVSGEI